MSKVAVTPSLTPQVVEGAAVVTRPPNCPPETLSLAEYDEVAEPSVKSVHRILVLALVQFVSVVGLVARPTVIVRVIVVAV